MFGNGTGFVFSIFVFEADESLFVGAAVTRFVAAQVGEQLGLVGQGLIGQCEASGLVDLLELRVHLLLLQIHFEVDRGAFDGPEAALAPFGNG